MSATATAAAAFGAPPWTMTATKGETAAPRTRTSGRWGNNSWGKRSARGERTTGSAGRGRGGRSKGSRLGELNGSQAGLGSFFVAVAAAAHRLSQSFKSVPNLPKEKKKKKKCSVHSCFGPGLFVVIRVQQVTGHGDDDDEDGKIKPSSFSPTSALFPSILRSCWRYRGRARSR